MIDEEKTCVKCGNTFKIHHPSQRRKQYCSAPCSNGYYNTANKKRKKK
jgi:hypothetical protein